MTGAWLDWMTAMSVQIAVVVAVVAVLERLLARRHPRLAAALWLAALAKLAVPPFLASPVGVLSSPASPAGDLVSAAFWTWLAGATLIAAIAILRHFRLRRSLLGGSLPMEIGQSLAQRMGLRRTPEVRQSSGVDAPCVLGWFRPVVLVPQGAVDDKALLHEFVHVRRRDPLMGVVVLAMQILYWFHPAAWVIRSRLVTLREVGCDAEVARVLGARAPEYRRMLLDFARRLALRPAAGASGLAFGRSRLVERLEWLSRPRGGRASAWAATLVAGLVLAACVPPVRPSAPPFAWPTLDQAQGCLQRRFVILEAMSRHP